jgi:hypothetical protein
VLDPPELCEREDDWLAIYRSLGDLQEHEKIRVTNPEGKHCQLLKKNPRACDGCPFNPLKEGRGRGLLVLPEYGEMAERALLLNEHRESGILDARELDPIDINLLGMARTEIDRLHRLELARLIAGELAVILGKMLGGK